MVKPRADSDLTISISFACPLIWAKMKSFRPICPPNNWLISILCVFNVQKRIYEGHKTNGNWKWNGFTVVTGISKQSAIFWYNSLTLLKPDINPVGLPWANWQLKTNLGGSLRVSPLDELAADRRLLDDENDDGRLDEGAVDALVLADDVVVSEVDGIIPLRGSSFFAWAFLFGGKIGIVNDWWVLSWVNYSLVRCTYTWSRKKSDRIKKKLVLRILSQQPWVNKMLVSTQLNSVL